MNASSLRAFPENFLNKFKDVGKNALFCNTCRIRVMEDEVLEEGWKRIRFLLPSIYVFFLNCRNYQKSANGSQNLPSHGFQVPSDSKNPTKTIILTKNQSPCNSSHSHQRTIQKITLYTFLRKKFVRKFFTNKFIFMIIKKIILLIIYV